MRQSLTKIQYETLQFIKKFINSKGYSPSLNEIGKHFKIASISSTWLRVENLRKKRYLIKQKNSSRSIQLNSNIEKQIIKFVKNFNPSLFNHRDRYKQLIDILKKYKKELETVK